jgi:hypothetical protein
VPLRWHGLHTKDNLRVSPHEECAGLISLALAAHCSTNENASDKPVDS